jgi:hypothetical protein
MSAHASDLPAASQRRGDTLLVITALAGPALWVLFLVVEYALEDPLACSPGATAKGHILGIGVRTIAAGVSVVLGSLTAGAGLLSFTLWRNLRTQNSTGRRGWMALAGVLNNALFAIVILTGLAPAFLLKTCSP